MATATSSFAGSRLRLARAFQGLSQVDVADAVGVSQAYVHQLESGSRQQPTPTVVNTLAEVLKVPPSFLYLTRPHVEFRDEECAFRRRANTSLAHRLRVLAHGTLFAEVVEELEQYVELPEPNVPKHRVASRADIETAAAACRSAWEIPSDAPIANMVRVLENAGVVVTRFGASADRIDAFSRAGHRDIVVLNTDKGSTSRTRYDCAHECGHLVMHRGLEGGAPDLEDEANFFAGALLLPRTAFVREFGYQPRVSFDHLTQLKVRWRVSIAAIVRRAYDLQLISAVEYRRLNILLRQDLHRGEPAEPPDEPPELFSIALEAISESRGIGPADLISQLGWSAELFERVTGFTAAGEQSSDIVAIESARRRRGR